MLNFRQAFGEILHSLANLQRIAEDNRKANVASSSTLQSTVLSMQDQTKEFWTTMATSGKGIFLNLLSETQNGLDEMTRKQAEQVGTTCTSC
jgi:hypothetical protein